MLFRLNLAALALVCGLLYALGSTSTGVERAIRRESFVQGNRSPAETLHELVFAVKQNQLDLIDRELLERSTPGHPLYQQWMSYNDIGRLVSNTAGTEAALLWLQSNKIAVTWKSKHGEYIKASAPIGVWEELLSTSFYDWEDRSLPSHMKQHQRQYRRALEYTMPEPLQAHLNAVFHTVQTPPAWKPHYHRLEGDDNVRFKSGGLRGIVPDISTLASSGTVTVPVLNKLYGIPSNTGSSAQQQAVFETGGERYSPEDLTTFQKAQGLPLQAVTKDFGYSTSDCNRYDCYEGNLDVQYMMGVAQATQMVYWYQSDKGDPFVDWITAVADTSNPPLVNSISWGSIEQANDPSSMKAFNTEAMKLAAMGVTIVVSTGDDGAASDADLCDEDSGTSTYASYWKGTPWYGNGYFPSFPATSPYVTAVGATMGPEQGSPEVACQSQLGGVITTGGGFSTYNPIPSWQNETVAKYFARLPADQQPTPGFNPNGRAFPDVSLIGVWYETVVAGSTESLFGTSASTPVFGAMISLINAARAAQNLGPVGFINPTLWAYSGAIEGNPNNLTLFSAFGDVTSGHNKCMAYNKRDYQNAVCCGSGFYAAHGWDPVTGLGSITFANLSRVLSTVVPVGLTYTDDDAGDGKDSSLMLIVVLVLIGSVLAAILIGGTVYSLCCMSRAPSNYAPAGRSEVAMTHFPDTSMHAFSTQLQVHQEAPPPPQGQQQQVVGGGAAQHNPMYTYAQPPLQTQVQTEQQI